MFRYRLRSIFILTFIVAFNAHYVRYRVEWASYLACVFGTIIGIYLGRLKFWRVLFFSGLGGFIGEMTIAPIELYYALQDHIASVDVSYSVFAKLRFFLLGLLALSAFGFACGMFLGLFSYPLLFVIQKYMNIIDRFQYRMGNNSGAMPSDTKSLIDENRE